MLSNVNVNYHSSIKIDDIYVDPFNISDNSVKASYIFITHSHYDHLSLEDIKKIVVDKTIFICPSDVEKELKKHYKNKIVIVSPGKQYRIDEMSFSTFSSYNIRKPFHPKSNGWVGYVIEHNGIRYSILGDTDLTDEVKQISCDVLFVPIGGTYTMDYKTGAELTNLIRPKVVVPVHYNGIVGSKNDEKEFIKLLDNIDYIIYL